MNTIGSARLAPMLLAAAGMLLAVSSAGAAALHFGDRHYVAKTTQGVMSEVALGHMAEQQAASPRVKAFGQRMVHDHSMDLEKLRGIARQANLNLPDRPTIRQRLEARRLRRLSGPAFDRAYINYEIKDHHEDIRDARREARGGKDGVVRQFAGNALPELNRHLQMAEQAAGR